MTPFKPTIFIDRVRVYKDKKVSFSGDFHEGLNIISGQNSSGKTSIMQLISYGLGRDIKEQSWTDEQLRCDFVIIETLLNGQYYCLKREIEKSGRRPLDIFEGRLETALAAGPELWSRYPYNSTSEKNSFSEALFGILEIPVVQGDSSKITMHQLMRLCYADQSTPAKHIFNLETWDTGLNRENVYRLITGFFSYSLFDAETELRQKEKEIERVIAEVRAITRILSKAGYEDISESFLDETTENLSIEEDFVADEIEKLLETPKEGKSEISDEADKKYQELNELRSQLESIESRSRTLKLEFDDSLAFVQELQTRKAALSDSLRLRKTLSDFDFEYCPSCFSDVEETSESHKCKLCKADLGDDGISKNYLRMAQEIDFQINESKRLLEKRKAKISSFTEQESILRQRIRSIKEDLAITRKSIFSKEDVELKNLFVRLGNVRKEIEELSKRRSLFSEIEDLRNNRDFLNKRIGELKSIIEDEKTSIEARTAKVEHLISEMCVDVLHHDLPRQEEFENAETVSFAPAANEVYVDGKGQFSESSQVYLKNAFHIALLRASIVDENMMFPRFLMLDGIENGGMEDIRSRKLQEFLSTISAGTEVPHQIIVSTAKISAELNNQSFTVGRFFTQEDKSISLQ
ncbi:MAG: AAA family ATPase [Marinobacter adhaerens]|nr:AAA family ATPase [Marinobacter adhaerens]